MLCGHSFGLMTPFYICCVRLECTVGCFAVRVVSSLFILHVGNLRCRVFWLDLVAVLCQACDAMYRRGHMSGCRWARVVLRLSVVAVLQ